MGYARAPAQPQQRAQPRALVGRPAAGISTARVYVRNMIGTSISRYDILRELGQGGMSVVYLAQDTALNRQVALKMLHAHLAQKPESRKRFRREAEAIARLRHPNILDVYDVSESSDARSYIIMEYVEGLNLRQFIDRFGPAPAEITCLLGAQLCKALAHAHQHGVIHRDLKPENIMISRAGDVKLMDFGIAHVIDAETMTNTGSMIGSPAHMPPEVIDGARVDARADIFSLGTVLYWICTGRLPFCGENTAQVLRNVMEGRYEPAELLQPTVSHSLSRIIERTLAGDPADRFASADALKNDLDAAAQAVGFDEDGAQLRAYFDDPAAYCARFAAEITPRLMEAARQAIARGARPEAIAYYNRVLAYEPQNTAVRQALAQLHRSGRLWVLGAAGLIAVAAAVGSWFLVAQRSGPNASEQPGLVSAVANAPAPSQRAAADAQAQATIHRSVARALHAAAGAHASQAADAIADEVARHSARMVPGIVRMVQLERLTERGERVGELASSGRAARMQALREASQALRSTAPAQPVKDEGAKPPDTSTPGDNPAQPARVAVQFKVFPPPTTLEIDGNPVRWQLGPVELTPGEHLLTASAPGCEPLRRAIVVDPNGNTRVPVVLDWKDAQVRVESNRNVLVYVDNEPNPRANAAHSTIRVSFPRGKFYTPRTVNLRVNDSANLQRVQTREVVVEPGESPVVRVNFP